MAITLLQPFNLDATANYTFNEVTVSSNVNMSAAGNITLGNVSNVHISGGTANYVLSTDGAGNLSWVAQSGGGTGSPGGTNTQIQFNDGGTFGGNANLTFDKTTSLLTITGNVSALNANLGNLVVSNFFSGSGNLLSNIQAANVSGTVANALVAGTVYTAAQPNITSVGLLTSLSVGPNSSITLTGTSGFVKANSIQGTDGVNAIYPAYSGVTGAVGITGNLTVGIGAAGGITANGVINFTNSSNVSLGAVGNIKITGGTSGYVLSTDGAGNLSWVAGGGGSGGATITDDTSTNATYYPVYATANSGGFTTAGITTTKLQFNPSLGQLTVQDLNTLSDATLKDNPEIINDPFVILKQLFGMSFSWKDSGKKSYGLMAQMLEKILPELVSTNAQGKKTVNYIPIIAFLIEAVKKQQEDIEELKKR